MPLWPQAIYFKASLFEEDTFISFAFALKKEQQQQNRYGPNCRCKPKIQKETFERSYHSTASWQRSGFEASGRSPVMSVRVSNGARRPSGEETLTSPLIRSRTLHEGTLVTATGGGGTDTDTSWLPSASQRLHDGRQHSTRDAGFCGPRELLQGIFLGFHLRTLDSYFFKRGTWKRTKGRRQLGVERHVDQ